MNALTSNDPLRPAPGGIKGWLGARAMAAAPLGLALLRRIRPVTRVGKTTILTRFDDVIEAFRRDADFDTPYRANIEVLTGGEPFFLGLRDGPQYRDGVAAMRAVMRADDLVRLGDRAEALAQEAVARANGQIEVVGFVRSVAFELYSEYLGIPEPEIGSLPVWCTRLFEFQFASSPGDLALRAEVDEVAPVLRAHIDAEIARRKRSDGPDDVLGRCIALQASGDERFTDVFIRTNLLCMLVGGPPQVPMLVPQGLEQLLRRPEALKYGVAAARAGDDARLWQIQREAMRFDPLAPALPRIAVRPAVVSSGRRWSRTVATEEKLLLAISSAMMDGQRLTAPRRFDPDRRDHEYIHFGHALHECFGRAMNEATLHRILKPLLLRPSLRRAPGREGHLSKRGIFADRLVITFS